MCTVGIFSANYWLTGIVTNRYMPMYLRVKACEAQGRRGIARNVVKMNTCSAAIARHTATIASCNKEKNALLKEMCAMIGAKRLKTQAQLEQFAATDEYISKRKRFEQLVKKIGEADKAKKNNQHAFDYLQTQNEEAEQEMLSKALLSDEDDLDAYFTNMKNLNNAVPASKPKTKSTSGYEQFKADKQVREEAEQNDDAPLATDPSADPFLRAILEIQRTPSGEIQEDDDDGEDIIISMGSLPGGVSRKKNAKDSAVIEGAVND